MLEKATGRPLEDLIREGILAPLSLEDTRSEATAIIQEPVLHAFDAERGKYEESTYWDPSWTLAKGAIMTSNIGDVLKSAAAIGTGRFLSADVPQAAARAADRKIEAVERDFVLRVRRLRHQRMDFPEPFIRGLRGDDGLSAVPQARDRGRRDLAGEGFHGGQSVDRRLQGNRRISGARGTVLKPLALMQAPSAGEAVERWHTQLFGEGQ